jgi:hypothetical protein
MYFARTAQKLREQMVRFSGELSAGLPKVARRFVAEMVFGIQALMARVAAADFAAVYLGLRMKLRVLAGHVPRASKRVFGIPDFRLYALADGLRQFLYTQTQGLKRFLELDSPGPSQPKLFDSLQYWEKSSFFS